jgi:DNA-binding NarL/FixJ family response regulator
MPLTGVEIFSNYHGKKIPKSSQQGTAKSPVFLRFCHPKDMEFRLRVLVIDDEPLVLSLLSEVLRSLGYETQTAASSAEARKIHQSFDADVAIIDVDLGAGPNGFDLATTLRSINPAIAIIFLTNLLEPKLAGRSGKDLPRGHAYLIKSRLGEAAMLDETIKQVSRGHGSDFRDDLKAINPLSDLSRSQLDAVRLLAQGKSNEEIAQERKTTVRAVRMILARAFQAMGLDEDAGPERRVQAAIKYLKTIGPRN